MPGPVVVGTLRRVIVHRPGLAGIVVDQAENGRQTIKAVLGPTPWSG